MVLKAVASVLAPGGTKARLSILIFHRVLPAPDLLFPGEQYARRFDDVLRWLSHWFRVLPLDAAIKRLKDGTLPSRAASISFDDGYADNATVALPLLQKHGMTATFFIATSFLDGGRMWNDSVIESVRLCRADALDVRDQGLGLFPLGSVVERQQAIDQLISKIKYLSMTERLQAVSHVEQTAKTVLSNDLMMTSAQVLQLRDAGMQIGAHTCSHPILSRLDSGDAEREMVDGKVALESLLGECVTMFAYPNGKPGQDYLAEHVQMAKAAGFVAAVSTAPGVSTIGSDAYQLPRFSPWDTTHLRYGLRMLDNLRKTRPVVV